MTPRGPFLNLPAAYVIDRLRETGKITTIIRLQGPRFELFLLDNERTPEQLRVEMSEIIGLIRQEHLEGAPEVLVAKLERLAVLRHDGELTDLQYEKAKQQLLGGDHGND